MSLVIVDGAIATLLQQKKTYLNGLTLRLYQNNHTPVHGDTAANYTECTYGGYAAQAVAYGSAAFDGTSGQGLMTTGVYTFQPTSSSGLPQNVYGYFVTDGSGNLIFAEEYAFAPFVLADVTKAFLVQLVMFDTYQ